MKIKQFIRQHRRDFIAIYVCEDCGYEHQKSGYDDRNFYDNVVPNMKCVKCGLSRNDMGLEVIQTQTKYPEEFII